MKEVQIFFLFILSKYCSSIPIDNGVLGNVEVACGQNSIELNFNVRNVFEGNVYVKGRFDEPGCRSDEKGRTSASIRLAFDACGVSRTRSANPRGIFVSTVVVISFHPFFLTKVDRAYQVQCFYMEADKTVSTGLDVSMINTLALTINVPMPICKYEILDRPDGQVVQFAIIGQPVTHQWSCESRGTVDIFCMRVHSCFVDDGSGDRIDLLNSDGCALDKYLLQNLEYPEDLKAIREAHVFKYADRPALGFQCQIEITIKEANQQCVRPTCPVPLGFDEGAAKTAKTTTNNTVVGRRRRNVDERDENLISIDVRSQTVQPIDTLEADFDKSLLPLRIASRLSVTNEQEVIANICLSVGGFAGVLAALFVGLIASLAITVLCTARRTKRIDYA